MTRKNISDALGNIDERHINEVAEFSGKKKKPAWARWVAAAACLALIVSLFGVIAGIPPHNIVDLSAEQAAGAFSGYLGATGTKFYQVDSLSDEYFEGLTHVPWNKYLDVYTPIENIVPTDTATFDEFFNRIAPELMRALGVFDEAILGDYKFDYTEKADGTSELKEIRRTLTCSSFSATFSQKPGGHPVYKRGSAEELDLYSYGSHQANRIEQLDGKPLEINPNDSNDEIIDSFSWATERLVELFGIKAYDVNIIRTSDSIYVEILGKSKKTSLSSRILVDFQPSETDSSIFSCTYITYRSERAAESDYYTLLGKAKKISLAQAEEMLQNGYVFGGHACGYCMSKQEEVVFDSYDYVGFEYLTGTNIRVPFYAFYKKISDTDEYGRAEYAKTYVCAVELSGLAEYFEAQKAYHK